MIHWCWVTIKESGNNISALHSLFSMQHLSSPVQTQGVSSHPGTHVPHQEGPMVQTTNTSQPRPAGPGESRQYSCLCRCITSFHMLIIIIIIIIIPGSYTSQHSEHSRTSSTSSSFSPSTLSQDSQPTAPLALSQPTSLTYSQPTNGPSSGGSTHDTRGPVSILSGPASLPSLQSKTYSVPSLVRIPLTQGYNKRLGLH